MTDDATKMKQERDMALAECERLRANAERYEWLRDTSCSEIYLHDVAGVDSCKQIGGEGLDAAIDAARAKP